MLTTRDSIPAGSLARRRRHWQVWRRVLVYLVMSLITMVAFIPLLWMAGTSLMTFTQLSQYPPRFIPHPAVWANYVYALKNLPFFVYLRNTVLVTFLATLGALFASSLVAYGFSRYRVRGRNLLFAVLIATMLLPGQVTMVPVFILFRKLGLYNSLNALIVPAFLGGGAFNIFLLHQFYRTLPNELFEAAKIDGCGQFRMYWQVALPLTKPALTAVAIFLFRANWTDFMTPLIYLTNERLYTLALGLRFYQGSHPLEFNYLMVVSLIFMLPMVIVFLFGQKQFLEGVTLTGINR